ncbi:MAG: hypothetical protein AAFT19_02605 [Pseudomonadota bacterium]
MTVDATYFAAAFAGLAALAAILVVIGRAAAECPLTASAARLGTWVVTTGFVTLGIGVVALIGAFLPLLLRSDFQGLYTAIGLIFLALGFGFYLAASMLRDILGAARLAARQATQEGVQGVADAGAAA